MSGPSGGPPARDTLSAAADVGLVGRDVEIATLVEALAVDNPIVVSGEAGIGKTTLVRAAAAVARRPLLEGGGFATLAWMPYLALQRAVSAPLGGEPAAVAQAVERAVGPDLLFVDDLQWTDRETRAVLGLLLGRLGIVVAIRSGDPAAESATADVFGNSPVPLTVSVRGLDRVSAVTLARQQRPDLSLRAAERLVDRAGGNPLVVEELARRGELSSSLSHAILTGLSALSERERAALALLGVAERPLPRNVVGAAGARLLDAGFLRDTDAGLEVRHALIADTVVGEIGAVERRAIHRRLAEVISDPAERARHLAAGGRRAEATRLARSALGSTADPRTRAALLVVAAEAASGNEGHDLRLEAAAQLQAIGDDERAIGLLQCSVGASEERRAWRAAILAESLSRTGRETEARHVLDEASGLRPDPCGAAALELAVSRAMALVNLEGRLDAAIALLQEAEASSPAAGRVLMLRGILATLRLISGSTDDVERLHDVWSASLASGDGATAASAATNLVSGILIARGAAAARAFALDAANRLAAEGYVQRAASIQAEATQVAVFDGDLRGAITLADELLEEPLGARARHRVLCVRGLALVWLGLFDDAQRTLDEATAGPAAEPDFEGVGEVDHARAELAFWSGRPGLARELAESTLRLPAVSDANYALPALTRAWADADLGRSIEQPPAFPPMRVLAGVPAEIDGLVALSAGAPARAIVEFDRAASAWADYHAPREAVCRWAAGEAARRADADDAAARLRSALEHAEAMGFEPLSSRIRRSLRLTGDRIGPPSSVRAGAGLLTSREREVLALVERGLNNTEIARRMGLGRPTVARMLSNAMLKLGASTRAQAVALSLET